MKLTIDQALQKGIEAHKAGQTQEADRLYTAILKVQPKHPDVNHNMGVLAVGIGKVQEALLFLETALEANPSMAQFWLSYISALINLDRLPDAKAALYQAKRNEAKGNEIDKLEQRLKGVEPTETFISQNQDPPPDQLQPLISLYNLGKFQQVLVEVECLLQQFQNSVILHNIQGAANKGLGQLDIAIDSYKKALAIKPDYIDAHNNLGNALSEQGQLDESIKAFTTALTIKPGYAEAYHNMGNVFKKQSNLEDAIKCYKKALSIKPNYARAHFSLASVLKGHGKLKEAVESYRQAIYLNPDDSGAFNDMGNALHEQGKFEEAVEAFNKALSIEPNNPLFFTNIGITLSKMVFKKPSPSIQKTIVKLLDGKSYVRPKDILKASISLLNFEPSIKEVFQKHSQGDLNQSVQETVLSLSKSTLLLKLMSVCPLADLRFESVLTDIRSGLLSSDSELVVSPETLRFQSALALQCFTNEYVYKETSIEIKAIQSLENLVATALSAGKQPSSQSILSLASYKALHEYEWCDLINVTSDVDNVFTRQVLEPKQENHLKINIGILEEITDAVSSKVREQYEASPYPRWVNLGLPLKAKPIFQLVKEMKLRLIDLTIGEIEVPSILIAGCGTGQHSIGTAAAIKNSQTLAVDLSLSSLAYATRKTEELGLQNINYMQADILSLGTLKKQFDIVESGGVLHHMDNPMAGWKVLVDCLKSGGLMKIGLYSELARQHIVQMQTEINQSGIGSSNEAMKLFRDKIINSNQEQHKQALISDDFYSLSSLRDLLFHVQEHRFTIPLIKECLFDLGLKFCGFEGNEIVQKFKIKNNGPDDPYDLDKWNTYEEANQHTFARMYQFWCQKVD